MDLKNLISRTSDDERQASDELNENAQPQPDLTKRASEPRLSIHNLMNNTSETAPPIPKPEEKEIEASNPTTEQRTAPFTNSNELGYKEEQPNNENIISPMQTLNASESLSEENASRIKKRNSISALTNEKDVEIPTTDTPPIPESLITKGNNNKHESIHKKIQKLEEIKKQPEVDSAPSDGKPRRYKTKPTWAQDYIPTINRVISSGRIIKQTTNADGSLGGISKLDIPSITGSIPRNDFNKLVTEWIWANVEGVKQDYLDVPNVQEYIEIELKLGNIWDKVRDARIQLPVNTECVVATDYVNQECFFKPGITLQNFNDTKTFMNKLIKEAAEQQQQGRGHANNKYITESSHVLDLIASDSRRNDKPISGRVSIDVKTKRKTNNITKQRISDLYLHFPNTLFDLRLSLSVELPNELNDAAFEIFKKRVTMEREKERISYIHQATFTKVDLTKVKEKNNRVPKYELELEINTPALLRSMDNVEDDPLYYMDLVQAFLDNGRIITRHLSQQRQ